MKFTKENAYEHLVSKLLTNKGQTLNISERSINEMLDTLIPLIANDETELNSFIDSVLPMFKTADLNVKNDVSVGIADFKKSYVPEPTKTEPKKEPEAKEDVNADLLKRLTDLENALKANETKDKIRGLQRDFISKAKEKGVKDEEWLNGYIGEIGVNEDFDVDARVESCLKLYNKSRSSIHPNVTPQGGGGSGTTDYLKSAIDEAAALAKAQRLIE